jgi:hypothetical protein
LAYKKQTLPQVGWQKQYLSGNYCDFLTPTDAVTEKTHSNIWQLRNITGTVSKCDKDAENGFAFPDGVHWDAVKDTCHQDSSSKWID